MSTMQSFSPKRAIQFGVQSVRKDILFLCGIFVAYLLLDGIIHIVPQIGLEQLEGDYGWLILSVWIAGTFVSVGLQLGWMIVGLKVVDGVRPALKDLFAAIHLTLIVKYFVASILTALLTILGFLLLIIPGIVLSVRLSFTGYYVLDKKLGPIQAMKSSWKATDSKVGDLITLSLYSFGIMLAGILLLFIGVIPASCIIQIAFAHAYRSISSDQKAPAPAISIAPATPTLPPIASVGSQ